MEGIVCILTAAALRVIWSKFRGVLALFVFSIRIAISAVFAVVIELIWHISRRVLASTKGEGDGRGRYKVWMWK